MKKIKDGWHKLAGQDVYVENGYVLRGMEPDHSGLGLRPTYPYEPAKNGGWDRVYGGALASTFTVRVKRGTLIMA